MTVFGQLGDPIAGAAACLCEHHGVAYAKLEPSEDYSDYYVYYNNLVDGAVITQAQITTTEKCCIVVNAATLVSTSLAATALEIERPVGTIRTMQEDAVASYDMKVLHHAAWEVLDPGTYTYYLVNRKGASEPFFGAWIKIIASDCEG